jgi:hypothetical protein
MNKKERPEFYDKYIECMDCGNVFLFSAGEAAYFWSKKLAPPKRCEPCRKARKLSIVPVQAINSGSTPNQGDYDDGKN